MTIYEVIIVQELEGRVLVEADSKEEAEEAAMELDVSVDYELDCNTTITEIETPYQKYWSGGESGDWVDA